MTEQNKTKGRVDLEGRLELKRMESGATAIELIERVVRTEHVDPILKADYFLKNPDALVIFVKMADAMADMIQDLVDAVDDGDAPYIGDVDQDDYVGRHYVRLYSIIKNFEYFVG